MSLKVQILSALKTKYKNLGLGEKVLEGISDILVLTTTEEKDIDTAVTGVEGLFKGFQSDVDTRVTTAVKKAKEETTKPAEQQPAGGNEPAKTEATPTTDFAKLLKEALAPIVQEITTLKAGNINKSRKQTLEEKLKDANPIVKAKILKDFDRMKIDSDDDFNAYVEEAVTDAGELSKSMTTETLGAGGRPLTGNTPPTGTPKQATKEELDAVMSNL